MEAKNHGSRSRRGGRRDSVSELWVTKSRAAAGRGARIRVSGLWRGVRPAPGWGRKYSSGEQVRPVGLQQNELLLPVFLHRVLPRRQDPIYFLKVLRKFVFQIDPLPYRVKVNRIGSHRQLEESE